MSRAAIVAGLGLVAALLTWQAIVQGGAPNPTRPDLPIGTAVLDIGVLVFREGLECVLVLAAITASMVGESEQYRGPIGIGVAAGVIATLLTWLGAVAVLNDLTESVPALHLQAITGLVAIAVLLVVMNWFFHKLYWSGWISVHTRRKKTLLSRAEDAGAGAGVALGLVTLGFTSMYREGFEVVLFLQSYRLKLGGTAVLYGVMAGVAATIIVAILAFVANHRLPYKRMLIATGALLGAVLLVMVGEQAQEMQLAGWLSTTPIPALEPVLRPWMRLWFAAFPTVETITAQLLAALLVLGSYAVVNLQLSRARKRA